MLIFEENGHPLRIAPIQMIYQTECKKCSSLFLLLKRANSYRIPIRREATKSIIKTMDT